MNYQSFLENSFDFDEFILIEDLNSIIDSLTSILPTNITENEILFYIENFFYIVNNLNNIEEMMIKKNSEFWEEYKHELTSINREISINIPKKDNLRYQKLRELENTHLINNRLVLELIIRDNEFKRLCFSQYETNYKEYIDKCKNLKKQFGFNVRDTMRLIASLPYYHEVYKVKEQIDDYSINNAPFVNDISNGIYRVIKFYHNNEKLYLIGDPVWIKDIDYKNKDEEQLYVKVIEKKYFAETLENCQNKNNTIIIKYKLFKKYNKLFLRVDEYFYTFIEKERLVKEELNDDFINNNLDNLAIEVEIFGRKVRQTLNNDNFSLELIDKDFINTLSENEKLDIEISEYNGTSFAEYNIPILSFAGSRLVNFQINLDSSEEDIVNSIKQLKKEANNIKTSNQILYSEDRVDQNIKISNKILSKGRKKIINFAEALYVYDVYKIIVNEFNKIRFELILMNKIYKKPNKINLDKALKELDQNSIKRIVMEHLEISETIYHDRLKLIKDLIKNKRYKQILLGNLEIKS